MKSIDLIELDKITTVEIHFDKNYQDLISNNFVLDSQLSQKWNDTNIYVNNKNGSCFVGTFGSHGGILINSIEDIETVLFKFSFFLKRTGGIGIYQLLRSKPEVLKYLYSDLLFNKREMLSEPKSFDIYTSNNSDLLLYTDFALRGGFVFYNKDDFKYFARYTMQIRSKPIANF
jgi:hypothetical protein